MQVRSIFMRLTGYFISNINQRMAIYSAENVAMVGEEAQGCEKELTIKPPQNREHRLAFIETVVLKV